MPQKHRVLIVEDDEHTRAKLCDAVSHDSNYILAGFCGTLKQARVSLQVDQPDVLLIDLGLPDGDGIELIRAAISELPKIHVMVISVFGDERHVINAIEAGAQGYLLKDADAMQITEAIKQLVNGGSPITPSVAIYLLKRLQNTTLTQKENTTVSALTKREQDVLRLIAKGLTYAEVSDALCVSINTIRVHMKNLFRKLSVTSRGEAVYEAVGKGIIKM